MIGYRAEFYSRLKCYRAASLKDPKLSTFFNHGCHGLCESEFLKALEMFTKAAEVGHVPSLYKLKMHANGQGVASTMTMLFTGLICR